MKEENIGMETTGWMGKLDSFCQWITRLAYINLLWLLFIGLGLFVLGAAPSTIAMFSIIRKWVQGETSFPIFTTFWKTYKKEFRKANILGILLFLTGIVLYMDWRLISSMQGFLSPILTGCLIGVAFLFTVVILYIFPVYVQYEYRTLKYLKIAFLIGVTYPLHTIAMILAVGCAFFISIFFNSIGMLFLGSGLAFALMYISNLVFDKVVQQFKIQTA
jgi:uncharacterized membrane protein YesL